MRRRVVEDAKQTVTDRSLCGERMQYYLELHPKIRGVEFESSAFARASKQLEAIAKRLGIRSHFELFSYAAQDDLCPPEHRETETPWFDAQVGIDWIDAVSKHIHAHPKSVPDPERLLGDFEECKGALQRAKRKGSKWHFAMDI